jgi:hypothetical protein
MKTLEAIWSKRTPTEEGWYWIKYKNKHQKYIMCPAEVIHVKSETIVATSRNDTFVSGPRHGGPGLKNNGALDQSVRFGPKIEEPYDE